MKPVMMMLALAGLPVFAQIQGSKAPPKSQAAVGKPAATSSVSVTPPAGVRPTRQLMSAVEKQFDDRIVAADIKDPFDLLGATRGLYLENFGAVFSTELSLIITPNTSAFKPTISDGEKASVHERKLNHLALLKKNMRDMMVSTSSALSSLSFNDQIYLEVRLLYYPWENRTGLPERIIMKGDRKNILAGNITEEQN